MVMSAADSMRANNECFASIQEGNDKEPKLKAVPLKPYALGTVIRMYPNPNPSRVTNVKCDTLIQTLLPPSTGEVNKHFSASTGREDMDPGDSKGADEFDVNDSGNSVKFPLRQRLHLNRNEIDEDFVNCVFKCIMAQTTCSPPATGMYQKEYNVPVKDVLPGPVEVDHYLE